VGKLTGFSFGVNKGIETGVYDMDPYLTTKPTALHYVAISAAPHDGQLSAILLDSPEIILRAPTYDEVYALAETKLDKLYARTPPDRKITSDEAVLFIRKLYEQDQPSFLVGVRVAAYKDYELVRVNISIKAVHLALIDKAARERGLSRSAFMSEAAIQRLGILR
jgi:hypothetical protein